MGVIGIDDALHAKSEVYGRDIQSRSQICLPVFVERVTHPY